MGTVIAGTRLALCQSVQLAKAKFWYSAARDRKHRWCQHAIAPASTEPAGPIGPPSEVASTLQGGLPCPSPSTQHPRLASASQAQPHQQRYDFEEDRELGTRRHRPSVESA